MAGYTPFQFVRPIMHRGPPPMPVVDIALVRPAVVAQAVVPAKPMRRGRLAPEVVAKIVAMREAGNSQRVIRRALGVSMEAIGKYTSHVAPPAGGWSLGGLQPKERNVAKAERLRRAGFSYAEIGDNIGCAGNTVRMLLTGAGITPRFRASPMGKLARAVAKATGVPINVMRQARPGRVGKCVPNLCRARAILFWLARQRFEGKSLFTIGKEVGGFHHSSVLNATRRVNALPGIADVDMTKPPAIIARQIWSLEWSGSSE